MHADASKCVPFPCPLAEPVHQYCPHSSCGLSTRGLPFPGIRYLTYSNADPTVFCSPHVKRSGNALCMASSARAMRHSCGHSRSSAGVMQLRTLLTLLALQAAQMHVLVTGQDGVSLLAHLRQHHSHGPCDLLQPAILLRSQSGKVLNGGRLCRRTRGCQTIASRCSSADRRWSKFWSISTYVPVGSAVSLLPALES